MLFKGTQTLKKGDVFRLVSEVGGYNNGFTSHDYTTYYETLPPEHLEIGLRIESDRMVNALFDPEETSSERTVIISEREGAENNPQYLLDEELRASAFRAHPYRWSVLGWKGDLQGMTREDLYGHYLRYYAPNNATLVVAGRLGDGIQEKVERYFGGIDRVGAVPTVRTVEPPQLGERRVLVSRPGPTAYLSVAYHAPDAHHPDFPALALLDALLSGAQAISFSSGGWMGRSARLHRSLVREQQVAASATSGFYPSPEPNLFNFSLTVRDGVKLEAAERALLQEIDRLRQDLATQEELLKAQIQMKAQVSFGRDGVTSLAYATGYSSILGDWQYLSDLPERLATVTAEDVRRVAQTYLVRENRSIGWFEPTPAAPGIAAEASSRVLAAAGAPGPAAAAVPGLVTPFAGPVVACATGAPVAAGTQIHRGVLDNGITFLVQQRTESPTVVVRGSLRAGSARESEEEAGLASLTARLLMMGTESRSADELADGVESLGSSMGFSAGAEQVYFATKGITDCLDSLVSTLADCLRRPTFPELELERLRGEVLTEIQERDDSTRSAADRLFRDHLYPEGHPYRRDRLGRTETVAALRSEDARRFYGTYYSPEGMILTFAGNVSPEAARELLERHFGGWRAAGGAGPLSVSPVVPPRGVVREQFEMPHKSQCDLVLGLPALERKDPDYYSLDFANLVLGQLGLYGRLGRSVRDEKGMAYYCHSNLYAGLWGGHWAVSAGVSPANVDRAVEAILEELRRIVEQPISEEELSQGRGSQLGSIPLRLETADGLAGYLHDIEYYDLGLDYLEQRMRIAREMTAEKALAAARKYLSTDRYVLAVAGPVG
jgi:zinc protease